MCEFEGCCWEETIPAHLWQAILEKGRELDLNKGGLWDSRLGAINLWASPEDKPSGWEGVEIQKHALNYPRSYLAGFYGEYLEAGKIPDPDLRALASSFGWLEVLPPKRLGGFVRVHLIITPYDKAPNRWAKVEAIASEADKEWCLGKWREIKEDILSLQKGGGK